MFSCFIDSYIGHRSELQNAPIAEGSPELPSPKEWGWEKNTSGSWEVTWTELPEASQACYELVKCSGKKGCRSRCKCVKAALQCTALGQCGGQCDRE